MKLTPNDFAILATLILAVILMAHRDDPRAWQWLKAQWSLTVGAWFARRRMVSEFNTRRYKAIRIGNPDEHSPGIMVMRRDVSVGWWT
jgi:hypothetical protein